MFCIRIPTAIFIFPVNAIEIQWGDKESQNENDFYPNQIKVIAQPAATYMKFPMSLNLSTSMLRSSDDMLKHTKQRASTVSAHFTEI